MSLTAEQVVQFVTDGFVKLERAFPVAVGERCVEEPWAATGYVREDPTT